MIVGFRCAVCGAFVDIARPLAFTCPNATPADPHHVLHLVHADADADAGVDERADAVGADIGQPDDPNPFVRYGTRLAWWAFARANGMPDADCEALTRELAGDFAVTPFAPSGELSQEVGAELWVKDETGDVAGSHKARHLVTILLHLRAAESLGLLAERPPLAIASCGNAALAAATLATRADWPIDVYVPTWMDPAFGRRLDALGANVERCERRAGGPPGDPAMLRLREAVAAGAVPFSVQGPANGYALDGGRTLGWEMADQAADAGAQLDRVVIQVGGGAFAACVAAGLGSGVRLDTVQAAGCAPLAETWERIAGIDRPERYWSQVMRPWPDPRSLADGILDDETYDWIAVVTAMAESGGHPIVAPEALIVRARAMATAAGYEVSATGSAGLAGVLASPDAVRRGDRIAIVMSGVARS